MINGRVCFGVLLGGAAGVLLYALNHEVRWIMVGTLFGAAIALAIPQDPS